VTGGDLQVVVLLDTTGSMGGAPIAEAKIAASKFLQRLPAGASIAVLGYDTRTTVVSDFSTDTGTHVNAIASLEADGETALYDAVRTSVRQFGGGDAAQRAVVLLTDGEDNASKATLAQTESVLRNSGVTLYGIEYRTAYTDQAGLGRLVAATDGRVVRANDPKALERVYREIAAEISNHYTLTYRSTAAGEADVRLIVAAPDGDAVATRSVDFPAAPAGADKTPVRASDDRRAGTVVKPAWYAQPLALIIGAGAIFVALALILLSLLKPVRARVRLSNAGRSTSGEGGMPAVSAVTDRLVQSMDRTLERRGRRRTIAALLESAGIALRPGEYLVVVLCAMIVVGVLMAILTNLIVGLLMMVATGLAARTYVRSRVERRRKAFGEQIADTLQLLAGSLRAGYGLMQAIDTVVREAPNPTAEEYRRLLIETRLGRDLDVALEELADRIQLEDFTWVVQAFAIHREVGGDLAAVLDSINETVRERDGIRRQIKVLSAEGKLSMWILLALPIVTAAALSVTQPDYLAVLTGHSVGIFLVGAALALMAVGALWIRRIVRLVF
jgi:tight adherence protein B